MKILLKWDRVYICIILKANLRWMWSIRMRNENEKVNTYSQKVCVLKLYLLFKYKKNPCSFSSGFYSDIIYLKSIFTHLPWNLDLFFVLCVVKVSNYLSKSLGNHRLLWKNPLGMCFWVYLGNIHVLRKQDLGFSDQNSQFILPEKDYFLDLIDIHLIPGYVWGCTFHLSHE